MSITFKTLQSYMPAIGLPTHEATPAGDNEGRILAALTFDTEDLDYKKASVGLIFSLQENGEYLAIRLFKVIDRKEILESQYLKEFLQYVMESNYTSKIGRWCLDPTDGDFYIDWAIGIEDNEKLTENQIKRIMGALVGNVRKSYAHLHRILKTGSKNPSKSRDDLIKDILFVLAQNPKYVDLLPKVVALQDNAKLIKIAALLSEGKLREAKLMIGT